jgi:hypothetical protein
MRIRRPQAAAGLLCLLAGCATDVRIAPPRVAQGGRALSISVTSTNDKRLVVATETGGLFRTYDGGKSWQHLGGLPNYKTRDVAHASLAPDTIIATTQAQYRKVNDGGIWRSTDGGGSWTQPPGSAPPPAPGCMARPGAHGISHMPLSRTFYVGTDCGIAVSNDNGATWSHVRLNPTSSDAAENRVRSLLVINRSSGVAAADGGLWFLGAGGVWTKAPPVETSGQVPVEHGFASPWWFGGSPVFFHASGGQKLWLSTDSGANWSQVPAPSINNREAFVRVGRSLTGDDSKFEVYYGDGAKLHRQTFSFPGPTGTGTWNPTTLDHLDPSDIAFDLDRRVPILLATDGGVHLTTDQGTTWTLTGGNYGGFVALQISEMAGQSVTGGSPHLDLYYGTQDNDIKGSGDSGHTWTGSVCCEGAFLRTEAIRADHDGARVTGFTCGPCFNFVTGPHLSGVHGWPNAPDGNTSTPAGAPFLLSGDSYLQQVADTASMPPKFDFFRTTDAGGSWSKTFTLALQPKGATMVAGPPADPTIYQGVQEAGSLPNGGTRFGMMRARGIAGQAIVTDAGGGVGGAVGGFGSLRTPIARYVVLGVDPSNPNRLIAPDVENGMMKVSADGGTLWYPLPQLTQAVTENGQYLFTVAELALASVIGWDPYDSCHILVGTMQNGIFRSTDGANTWKRIDGSKAVTSVSSFYFPPTGAVWVSTNGRGLWTLSLARKTGGEAGQCRFPVARPGEILEDTVIALDPATGSGSPFKGMDDPAVCPTCSVVVVRNGWITDLQMSGEDIRELAISGGTIAQLDRSGKEIPLAVANVYRPGEGRLEGSRLVGRQIGSRRVRGLILDGTRLRLAIASGQELPFAPTRTPLVFAHAARSRGVTYVEVGEPVRVTGTGFLTAPGRGRGVRILFDGEVVAPDVPVGADGTFSVDIPMRRPRGEVMVTAEQRDGLRLTSERTTIDVVTKERPEGPTQAP